MTRVRAALTQTANYFQDMPTSEEELDELSESLDAIREANVTHHLDLLAQAASMQVQAICLGELFCAPYFALGCDPMWFELAEDALQGPTISRMRNAAKEHNMLVVAPIYELDGQSNRRFNTAVVIENTGEVLGKYRKCHIPEGTNDQGTFYETFYYEKSDGQLNNGPANCSKNPFFPVFRTSVGKVGIAICYDRHFPGVMKTLAHQGAQLVFSPAVTLAPRVELCGTWNSLWTPLDTIFLLAAAIAWVRSCPGDNHTLVLAILLAPMAAQNTLTLPQDWSSQT
jgi:N-carbamoylputrescine amidase